MKITESRHQYYAADPYRKFIKFKINFMIVHIKKRVILHIYIYIFDKQKKNAQLIETLTKTSKLVF